MGMTQKIARMARQMLGGDDQKKKKKKPVNLKGKHEVLTDKGSVGKAKGYMQRRKRALKGMD